MGQLALNGRNKKFKQGIYKPKNPDKFWGKDGYAIYRSGLELNYFLFDTYLIKLSPID